MSRDPRNGRFLPGASGNPAGRPADQVHVRRAARLVAGEAVLVLIRAVHSDEAPWPARVAAARQLLAIGYGRPRRQADPVSDLPELDAAVAQAVRLYLARYRLA